MLRLNAVRAVACVANEQLGAEDGLGLRGISRRGHDGNLRNMSRRGPGGRRRGFCRRGQRGQHDQNAENSRKVIDDHVLHSQCSSARGSSARGPVTRPTPRNHLKHAAVWLVAQEAARHQILCRGSAIPANARLSAAADSFFSSAIDGIEEVAQEILAEEDEFASEGLAEEAETSTPAASEEAASGGSVDDDENQ